MHPHWILLLSILLGHAICGPQVDASARALALLAYALLLLRERTRGALVVLGLVIGLAGGWELTQRVEQAARWDGYRGPARFVLREPVEDGRAEVWLWAPAMPAQKAFLSGLGELEGCDSGIIPVRAWLAPPRRNPDDRDRRRSALPRGVLVRARGLGPVHCEEHSEAVSMGIRDRAARALRDRLRPVLGQGCELWMALLLGDRTGMGRAAQERFRGLGLAHLLALSGLHVGLLAILLLRLLRAPRSSAQALWILLPLFAWAWLAGMGPSLFRAVTVLSWLLVGRRLGREHRPVDGLAAAGVLELLWRPASIAGLAWWLSYAATLALLRATELRLRRRWISALLVVCVAPLATSPWVLSAFGRMPYAGPVWNLIVGPCFAVFMGSGVLLVLLGLLLPPIAPATLSLLSILNHALGWVLRVLERVDPGALGHPAIHGEAWAIALVASALVLVPELPGPWKKRLVLAGILVAAAHLGLARVPSAQWWSLDVGQGDGGVLRVGRSRWMVVDVGNGPFDGGEERVVLPYLSRRNAHDVALVLTHGHRDHYGGAPSLLQSGRIGRLYLALSEQGRSWTLPLLAQAEEQGVEVTWLQRGDVLQIGDWRFDCLWPPAARGHATNDRSLVLRGGPADQKILLTGDLEAEAEESLLQFGDSLQVAVLKVAHHGSKTGTGPGLLARLGGEWALVSCGVGNRYGHPHELTLEALRRCGWSLLRTDHSGAVGLIWTPDGPMPRTVRPPP